MHPYVVFLYISYHHKYIPTISNPFKKTFACLFLQCSLIQMMKLKRNLPFFLFSMSARGLVPPPAVKLAKFWLLGIFLTLASCNKRGGVPGVSNANNLPSLKAFQDLYLCYVEQVCLL